MPRIPPVSLKATDTIVHRTIDSMRASRKKLCETYIDETKKVSPLYTIGFVPTMGALHEGHASLIRQARKMNDIVVASIFVNPTQFGPGEDLDRYPRSLESDTALLDSLGVDHVFAPDATVMYGPNHCTFVEPMGFDDTAEGRSRPGHFRGVATIVLKLLNIVQPTTLYLGQKDAAQCVMIRRMMEDLNLMDDCALEVVPTVREGNGLALSSRNSYLTLAERRAAPIVYKSLCEAVDYFDNYKKKMATKVEKKPIASSELQSAVASKLRKEPLVSAIHYISIDHRETMRPVDHVDLSEGAIVSLACQIGSVRLIDNIILK